MKGLKNVRNRRTDALAQVGWDRLEVMLAAYYSAQGYQVDHCGTGNSRARFDGGIDLKLRKDDAYLLVQCKHWNAYKVTHNAVHELLGIMVNQGATGAILVSSGEFTKAAIEASARQGHVQLVDGDGLREMLGALVEAKEVRRQSFADDFARTMSTSPTAQRPATAAKERLVSELERGINGRGPTRHPRKAVKGALGIALALATILFLGWMGTGVLQRLAQPRTAVTPSDIRQPASMQETLPSPTQPAANLMRTQLAGSQTEQDAGLDAGHRQQTPAEIRESQRRAAEAMKIIEATTPEM